jgi:hypothetical protein
MQAFRSWCIQVPLLDHDDASLDRPPARPEMILNRTGEFLGIAIEYDTQPVSSRVFPASADRRHFDIRFHRRRQLRHGHPSEPPTDGTASDRCSTASGTSSRTVAKVRLRLRCCSA